jgi:hypothetical protein
MSGLALIINDARYAHGSTMILFQKKNFPVSRFQRLLNLSVISVKKDIKEKWVTALRSGEYPRGIERLHTADGGYCCLGVLCELYRQDTGNGEWIKTPPGFYTFFGQPSFLPDNVSDWLGVDADDIKNMDLVSKNDLNQGHAYSFHDIADIIENYKDEN